MTSQYFVKSEQEIPPLLFKYRSFDNEQFVRDLLGCRLYCSPPVDFNDPFDCQIPTLATSNQQDRKNYVATLTREFEENGKIGSDIRLLESDDKKWDELINKLQKDFEKNFSEDYKVYCFSADPLSIPMWSYYGDSHRGLCVGFDTKLLISLFAKLPEEASGDFISGPYRVDYQADLPTLEIVKILASNYDPTMGAKALLTKAECWAHEKEWRVLWKTTEKDSGNFLELMNLFNFCRNLKIDHLVSKIYVGCKFPEEKLKCLRKITNSLGVDSSKISKLCKDSKNYQLIEGYLEEET